MLDIRGISRGRGLPMRSDGRTRSLCHNDTARLVYVARTGAHSTWSPAALRPGPLTYLRIERVGWLGGSNGGFGDASLPSPGPRPGTYLPTDTSDSCSLCVGVDCHETPAVRSIAPNAVDLLIRHYPHDQSLSFLKVVWHGWFSMPIWRLIHDETYG